MTFLNPDFKRQAQTSNRIIDQLFNRKRQHHSLKDDALNDRHSAACADRTLKTTASRAKQAHRDLYEALSELHSGVQSANHIPDDEKENIAAYNALCEDNPCDYLLFLSEANAIEKLHVLFCNYMQASPDKKRQLSQEWMTLVTEQFITYYSNHYRVNEMLDTLRRAAGESDNDDNH